MMLEHDPSIQEARLAARSQRCAFVVATYGPRHAPFVYAFIESLSRCYPDPNVLLFYSHTPEEDIAGLLELSSRLVLRDIGAAGVERPVDRRTTGGDVDQAVSRKLQYWGEALNEIDAEVVAFCDSDLLVTQKFDHFLEDEDDLVITYRDTGYLLNSGLILCRNNDAIKKFIVLWRELTEEILNSPERAELARERNGGADQDSLVSLLGYERQTYRFTVQLPGGEQIRVRPVDCMFLNNIGCSPLTSDKHIFHLKGGWHPALLDGGRFPKKRNEEACQPVLAAWLDCFASAARRSTEHRIAKVGLSEHAPLDGHQLALRTAVAEGAKRVLLVIPPECWPITSNSESEILCNKLTIEATKLGLELIPVPGCSGMVQYLAGREVEPYGLVLGDTRVGAPNDILVAATMASKSVAPRVILFPTVAEHPKTCFSFAVVSDVTGTATLWVPRRLDTIYTVRQPRWLPN